MNIDKIHDMLKRKKHILQLLLVEVKRLIISSQDDETERLNQNKDKLFKQLYEVDMEIKLSIKNLGLPESKFAELNKEMEPFLKSLLRQEKDYFAVLQKTRKQILCNMRSLNTRAKIKNYLS